MESLGGVNTREFFDDKNTHGIVKAYEINLDESIRNHALVYEPMIEQGISGE